jgi:toxin CptA
MPHSHRSSNASAPCRLEWRPSRWLLSALLALTLAAPLAVLASELPRHAAWPLAVAAGIHGLRLMWREHRRVRPVLVFPGGDAPVEVDAVAVDGVTVSWRGPLAFVSWRDGQGRTHRLSWWPDTLPAASRRELRLAAPGPSRAARLPSVAP